MLVVAADVVVRHNRGMTRAPDGRNRAAAGHLRACVVRADSRRSISWGVPRKDMATKGSKHQGCFTKGDPLRTSSRFHGQQKGAGHVHAQWGRGNDPQIVRRADYACVQGLCRRGNANPVFAVQPRPPHSPSGISTALLRRSLASRSRHPLSACRRRHPGPRRGFVHVVSGAVAVWHQPDHDRYRCAICSGSKNTDRLTPKPAGHLQGTSVWSWRCAAELATSQ